MKIVISFLIAALLVGFVLLAIFYWFVKMDFTNALIIGSSGAASAFVVDYIREKGKNCRTLKY